MTVPGLATTLHRVFSSFSRQPTQISMSPNEADDMLVKQVFDTAIAHTEGWDVFDCGLREDGSACREIQRLDNGPIGSPIFADDGAAWEHVVLQARAGSKVHLTALTIVDPVEQGLIRFWCSAEDLLS